MVILIGIDPYKVMIVACTYNTKTTESAYLTELRTGSEESGRPQAETSNGRMYPTANLDTTPPAKER